MPSRRSEKIRKAREIKKRLKQDAMNKPSGGSKYALKVKKQTKETPLTEGVIDYGVQTLQKG